jgi:hypothetical protein
MDAVITGYSQRFLDFLRLEDSALHAAMKPAVDAAGKPTGFLIAEVPSPNPLAAAPLWVTTEDDEITVGFDAFHTHFAAWDESTTEVQSFAGALALAHDITAERVLVASWWLEVKWSGSQLVEPGFSPERPKYVVDSAAARVRSWTGKLDQ